MKIDIENIKNNIKKTWVPIYKLIDATFFEETENVPQDFLDSCENNPNQPKFLPSDVKTVLKRMATEQGLY